MSESLISCDIYTCKYHRKNGEGCKAKKIKIVLRLGKKGDMPTCETYKWG